MKKLISLSLSILMAFSLAACGNEDDSSSKINDSSSKVDDSSSQSDDSSSQSDDSSSNADDSVIKVENQIDDGKFTSEKYGYIVTIPENWSAVDKDAAAKQVLVASGVAEDQVDAQKELFKAQGVEYAMMAISTTIDNTTGGSNNIIIQEMDKSKIGDMTIEAFLTATVTTVVTQFEAIGFEMKADPKIETLKSVGYDGYYSDVAYSYSGVEMSQHYFIFDAGTHYILFTGTCATEDFRNEMVSIVNGINKLS